MNHSALLLVIAAVATPAAAGAPPTQAQVAAKPSNPQDKVVCRFINTTGSRLIGERVCKTRAEWEHESDETRNDFEQRDQRPSGDTSPAEPN
jgi:hypothetical protein